MSDGATWALVVLGVVELFLTVALFYVAAKAGKIDHLKEEIKAAATELIRAQIELAVANLRNENQRVMTEATESLKDGVAELRGLSQDMRARLDRGDEKFDAQGDAAQKLELKLQHLIAGIKEFVLANYATKEHVRKIEQDTARLDKAMARCQAVCRYQPSGEA